MGNPERRMLRDKKDRKIACATPGQPHLEIPSGLTPAG